MNKIEVAFHGMWVNRYVPIKSNINALKAEAGKSKIFSDDELNIDAQNGVKSLTHSISTCNITYNHAPVNSSMILWVSGYSTQEIDEAKQTSRGQFDNLTTRTIAVLNVKELKTMIDNLSIEQIQSIGTEDSPNIVKEVLHNIANKITNDNHNIGYRNDLFKALVCFLNGANQSDKRTLNVYSDIDGFELINSKTNPNSSQRQYEDKDTIIKPSSHISSGAADRLIAYPLGISLYEFLKKMCRWDTEWEIPEIETVHNLPETSDDFVIDVSRTKSDALSILKTPSSFTDMFIACNKITILKDNHIGTEYSFALSHIKHNCIWLVRNPIQSDSGTYLSLVRTATPTQEYKHNLDIDSQFKLMFTPLDETVDYSKTNSAVQSWIEKDEDLAEKTVTESEINKAKEVIFDIIGYH